MIESVSIIVNNKIRPSAWEKHPYKLILDLSMSDTSSFDISITFKHAIAEFRNHDYTWVKCNQDRIAAEFSPKILKLDNGQLVQANINSGIWEVNKENPKTLLWRFNPENAFPLTKYTGTDNQKVIVQANHELRFVENPALLFPLTSALEYSRSLLPFTAIACFTDHCDFDTPESLLLQREFFKTHGVTVTKGIFLNHYSKRENNASFEKHSVEFHKWIDDGHELAYHSLSQSIKTDKESLADFRNFLPPLPMPTWIDHGYQPYNFTMFEKNNMDYDDFEKNLKGKKIRTLWNYIDSGTAATGVINQINPDDFTLASFSKGIRQLKFSERMGALIKNIMFHFYADERMIVKYKSAAACLKKIIYQKKLASVFTLVGSLLGLLIPLLRVFIFWNNDKNVPYKLAKYTPVLFRHKIANEEFIIFQTLEMIDFKTALHPVNITRLIDEKGLFIAHTYFSAPMEYHQGKIFDSPDKINRHVAENFAFLGSKIANGEIWNPTLHELADFFANFEKALLDIDHEGNIVITNTSGLAHRTVS